MAMSVLPVIASSVSMLHSASRTPACRYIRLRCCDTRKASGLRNRRSGAGNTRAAPIPIISGIGDPNSRRRSRNGVGPIWTRVINADRHDAGADRRAVFSILRADGGDVHIQRLLPPAPASIMSTRILRDCCLAGGGPRPRWHNVKGSWRPCRGSWCGFGPTGLCGARPGAFELTKAFRAGAVPGLPGWLI
jgi:hypothetical protein